MDALNAFVTSRLSIVVLLCSCLAAARATGPSVPDATLPGLAELLGRASDGVVREEDVAWEPSGGLLEDAILGRAVLFLATPHGLGARDLFRARVRLGLDGRPARVVSTHNLTRTPLGDDAGLQVRGRTAAVATSAFGTIQGISIFELGRSAVDVEAGWLPRALSRWTTWRLTGSPSGMSRTDVVLEVPRSQATLALGADSLRVDLERGDAGLVVDLRQRSATASNGGKVEDATVLFRTVATKPVLAWAADELRAAIGPARVAWLEHRLFGARDSLQRAVGALGGTEASVARGSARPRVDSTWPPPEVPSAFQVPEQGEGTWEAIERDWLPRPAGLSGDRPPYFYRTFIRPDPDRPYAKVHLVALDMRQLEVRMVAGYEDPEPLVGPPGTGRLPEAPDEYRRVAAVFNGAFKTVHGEYGMMVDRRVIVPPVPHAATIVATHDGELGFGTWPDEKHLPGDVVSFRQNLDPLVAGGVVNPTRREAWGWQIAGEEVHTERTALCVTGAGQVLYGWGTAVSGPRLAEAMARAGCDYAVHLDMNPTHCGFVLTGIDDLEAHQGHLELVHEDMSYPKLRAVAWSPKDFFYVRVRDAQPPAVLGSSWKVAGTQPEPAWLPGLLETQVTLGELRLRLVSFEKGRFDWVVRAGDREPSVTGGAPKRVSLAPEQQKRLRASVGLGRTTARTGYGLAFGTKASLALRKAYATLVLEPGDAPGFVLPGEEPALTGATEAVQLPLIAKDGEVLPEARRRGARRLRGGICRTPFGRVLYGEVEHDSDDPVAKVLLAAGCRHVLSTDRGSRHPAELNLRAGADDDGSRRETSQLFALSRPARPHAFVWGRPAGG